MKKNTVTTIQLLRGLAAVAVVMFHMGMVERKYSPDFMSIPEFFRMGQTGVDLFFVISGFIMAYITHDAWGGRGTVRFLLKRMARIFPVYWCYSLITLGVYVMMPQWVNSSQGHQVDLIASFLLLPYEHLPLVMVAWSLVFEVYFYIIFSGLIRFKERTVVLFLALWSTMLIVYNLLPSPSSNYLVLFYTSPSALEFMMGVAVFLISQRLPKWGSPIIPILTACSALLLVYYTYFALENNSELLHIALLGVSFGLIVLSVVYLEKHWPVQVPKAFMMIGDASYSIYLSHVLVINGLAKIFAASVFAVKNPWWSWTYHGLTLLTVIGLSIVSYRILERIPYRYLSKQIDSIRS